MTRPRDIHSANQLEQLYRFLETELTGAFVVDGEGRRLSRATARGVAGINRTVILEFETVDEVTAS
jgi:hypothetical protein